MPEDDVPVLQRRFLELLQGELAKAPDRFVAIAGAVDVFQHLRSAGWRVALATGGWSMSAAAKLRAAGVSAAGVPMACADDAESREDIVRLARERAESETGVRFGRVVSVGDAWWDVRTAASLGLPFVGVATGVAEMRLRTAGASTILPDLGDASAVVAALESARVPEVD